MEKLQTVVFPNKESPPLQLEGRLHIPDGNGPWLAAVICHPHPLGGGTMHNAVVAAIARALAGRGMAALRFNFRGTGRSGGRYDHGRGEQADVAGALEWLLAQPWVDSQRLSVAGYSFGAWVGLTYAQSEPRVGATAAVALVPWNYDADLTCLGASPPKAMEDWGLETRLLQLDTRPKLFVSGEYDAFAPPGVLRPMVDLLPLPKELHILPGADHFLQGREQEVGRLVAEFLTLTGS